MSSVPLSNSSFSMLLPSMFNGSMDNAPLERQGRILGSGEDLLHNFAFDIRQPIVASLKTESKPFVMESEQMQNGRLQVMNEDFVLRDTEAKLGGFAVAKAGLHATARHDHRVTIRIMIAAQDVTFGRAAF